MKLSLALTLPLIATACSSGSSGTPSTPDTGTSDSAASDTSTSDVSQVDALSPAHETGPGSDASDAGTAASDAGTAADALGALDGLVAPDAPDALSPPDDGGCPMSWTAVPTVDPAIALPDGGGALILHALGTGTQDYTCTATLSDAGLEGGVDAGASFAWAFSGPEATLGDCTGGAIGRHFASAGGPGQPEWMTSADNSFVIAKKVNPGFTPDGGGVIPWLLLQTLSRSDAGALGSVQYVQRLNTSGGLSPAASTCDTTHVGVTQKVNYTADYYFFGP